MTDSTLEKRLTEIAQKHPYKSTNMVTLLYQHVVGEYGCPQNIALDYVTYAAVEDKPKHFLIWYVEYAAEKRRMVRAMSDIRSA